MRIFFIPFASAVPQFYMQSILEFLSQADANIDRLIVEDKVKQVASQVDAYLARWRREKPADFLAERSEWMKDEDSAALVCRMVEHGVVDKKYFHCSHSVSEMANEAFGSVGGVSEILRFTAR